MQALANDHWPTGVRNVRGEEQPYRIRVGPYRIVYDIYDEGSSSERNDVKAVIMLGFL